MYGIRYKWTVNRFSRILFLVHFLDLNISAINYKNDFPNTPNESWRLLLFIYTLIIPID